MSLAALRVAVDPESARASGGRAAGGPHTSVVPPQAHRPRMAPLAPLLSLALLAAATAQSPPAAASPTPPPAAGSLRLWLRPEGLGGDRSRAGCAGQPIPVWRNAAPLAATFLLGNDASVPALQTAPSRLFDNVSGACVARFTASAGTALAAPTLDLTPLNQSYTVTIVARMWNINGANRARVISGTEPFYERQRDWMMGWHEGRSDMAYYTTGTWLGGVVSGLVEAWGTRDWIMYTLIRDGSSGGASYLFKNGNLALSGELGGGPPGILLGGGIRHNHREALWELSDCDVAELLVHDTTLSIGDRLRLEGDLAAKYRMSHRLPAIHPYYAVPAPAPPPIAMPSPRVWLRPESGLPTSGSVPVWANRGTGGAGLNGVFSGSGGNTAPLIVRARFVNRSTFSAVRFTSAQCSRLNVPIDLNGDAQSSTIVAVSRMWGANRRRVVSSNVVNWIMGWVDDRMDVFHIDDGNGWLYYPGLAARPEFGALSWQLHAMTRRGTSGSVPSEVAAFSNGIELIRANYRGGFAYPQLGGGWGCSDSSDADVAELLIFDYLLSADQLAAVTSYLQARYSIGGNEPIDASPAPTQSISTSSSPSPGALPTPSATSTATSNRCAIDESFLDGGVPSSWSVSPPSLVSVVTSAAPRGAFGATMYDPLRAGSPFAYLRTGAGVGEYTILSAVFSTETSVTVSADVQFDAGTELPFNDDAYVTLDAVGSRPIERVNVCGVAWRDGDVAKLTCPPGGSIARILFASYGNPTLAGCNLGQYAYGACNVNSSLSAATAGCIGRASCTVRFVGSALVGCAGSLIQPALAVVAECLNPGTGTLLFARNVAGVGAYTQSGWTRISATLDAPGSYRLSFGVRSVGAVDPTRASALAVDNVLACLHPPRLSTTQLPLQMTTTPVPSPAAERVADAVQVSFISAGVAHTCGITPLNRLLCWGSNTGAAWGESTVFNQAVVPAELAFSSVISVGAGGVHTCTVLSDGRVRCFGSNGQGQCNVPSALFDGRVAALTVASGVDFSCAITVAGETLCWGNIGSPPAILYRGTLAVAAGARSACAITTYRTATCWGVVPQPPTGLVSVQHIVMSTWNLEMACAVTLDGVVCWGEGYAFSSDQATVAAAILGSPVNLRFLVPGGTVTSNGAIAIASDRIAVTCGLLHCCYQFRSNGTLSCSGDNSLGQATPPIQQPFATPLPRFYPPSVASPGSSTSEPCSTTIGVSAATAARDCSEYSARSCNRTEGVRWILARSGTAYEAVCYEGFALAMKLSRSGTVFNYDAGFWTNTSLLNSNPSLVGVMNDAKLAPYVNQRLQAVLVRNRAENTSVVLRGFSANSFADLFFSLNGREQLLFGDEEAQRAAWLSLAPGVCTQPNCNTVGFNTARFGGAPGRIVFMANNEYDCRTPDSGIVIGSRDGNSLIPCVDSSSPSLELYVRGSIFSAATPSATRTPPVSATLSPGALPSSTATVTVSRTLTSTASPSGTPYCAEGEYQYFPGYDVDGNTTLSAASVGSERDCARMCCDVPRCNGYSFVNDQFIRLGPTNCVLLGNVTGISRNRLLNGGVRKRVL